MNRQMTCGTSSVAFRNPVFIQSCACAAGQKESEGPLGSCFDIVNEDPMFGADTWEAAESNMQKQAATLAVQKAGLKTSDIRLLFAGDLLAQTVASSFGTAGLGIPFYGLFGACSTMGESLSLGSMCIAGGYGSHILCATSSHFASAEKEFRFPLGYGNQRPLSATWTVTGAGACVLGSNPPARYCSAPPATDSCIDSAQNSVRYPGTLRNHNTCAVITGITTGRLIDFGFKDSLNMGGCMAPAACDTIAQNLSDFNRNPDDYDAIFTGDLGMVGQKILFDLLAEKGIDISSRHQDCGMLIYDPETQDTHSGGSGCGCAATVLAGHILPGIISGTWKRILFVPTGALLSKVSFNEGDSIPGIAHAVVIEQYSVPSIP